MLSYFRSLIKAGRQKRLQTMIRQQHPELTTVADADLIATYINQATREVAHAETMHRALTPDEPFDMVLPPLFKEALLFYASEPAVAYAFVAIKQQIEIEQLNANAELYGQQLDVMKELVNLHEQKEQRIQQVLDHYGIDEDVINRAEFKLATDTIQLKNRHN